MKIIYKGLSISINPIEYPTIDDDCMLKLICKIRAYACAIGASTHVYKCFERKIKLQNKEQLLQFFD